MSHYADETYEVYNERIVRARKPRHCCACYGVISPRTQYTRVATIYDGRVTTYTRCAPCQRTHEHLRDLGRESDRWPDERLACGREYEDEWDEPPPADIASLAFALPGDELPQDGEPFVAPIAAKNVPKLKVK
jgi:hypothetical protein